MAVKGVAAFTPTLTLIERQFWLLDSVKQWFGLKSAIVPVSTQLCWLDLLIQVMMKKCWGQKALEWGLCASRRPLQEGPNTCNRCSFL